MITTIVLNPAVDRIYFVDDFEAGGLYRVKEVLRSAGGKGINVARVAKTLGESVAALGFKAGQTGAWLENQLVKTGVLADFIEVVGESRTNNNIIDRARNTETEVLEVGPSILPKDMDLFIELYERKIKNSDIVILSGGLPQGVSSDIYKTLIEIARPCGVKTILDASGEILRLGMEARPYMIKPNLRELCALVNRELKDIADVAKVCRDINAGGIEVVLASMGEKGAVIASKDKCCLARVPEIKAVNTIGSGDSMVAGFAVGISRQYSLEDAFLLASACAVNNAQHAEIGVVDKASVDELVKNVRLESIK